MAIKTRAQLMTTAELIRDEVGEKANTATRVGGFNVDLLDSIVLADEQDFQATVVATANVGTLSGITTTVDGVLLDGANVDVVLLTGQTDASENGAWVIQSGPWTRPQWFETGTNAGGVVVGVQQGTTYNDTRWVVTTDDPDAVVDTDDLAWDQMPSDEGNYLLVDGSRAMTGDLNMGSQAITSVGNVDGRDVSADGATLDAHDGAGGAAHAAVTNSAAGFAPAVEAVGRAAYSTGSTIGYADSVRIATAQDALEVHGTDAVATTGAVRASKDNAGFYARNEADDADIRLVEKDPASDDVLVGDGPELLRTVDDSLQALDASDLPDAPTDDAFRVYSYASGEVWIVKKGGNRTQLA